MKRRDDGEMVAPMEKLMTLEEVAEDLCLSKDTVYRLANTGELPAAAKVRSQWRFRKEDVDQWLEKNKNARPEKTPDEG